MKTLTKVTKSVKEKEVIRTWHLVDVSGQILGRVSGTIAKLLQGKHKVNYVPYLDCGDYVVVINAKKIKVSGSKDTDKTYTYYSGYPGGLKRVIYHNLMEQNPTEIIKHAVLGMLPKNKLRDRRAARLFIFPDENHSYKEQFKNSKS